ncbi:stationary phase inducible protein CsiE [Yersinia similis]|uniref:stationary phase inducible protein CsiE n=1 Tax=Yersinia similis TaxID=367190 RepID=UPI00061C6AEE|nr:stationary phase inducible protein CsiE [Yersinia similis]CNB13956.1 stationary phase inducible protein CsiE [Yersinia similis]
MRLNTPSEPQLSDDQPLSSQQRRCHMLLMLFMPAHKVQLDTISRFNRADLTTTRQDIAEVASEIQRFYHLELNTSADDYCQISGSLLDKRLCFIHWLRRGLRYCPDFVEHHFSPYLYQALAWDDGLLSSALRQIVYQCEPHLNRQLSEKDRQFLQLYLLYCVRENQQYALPQLSMTQRQWLEQKPARVAADHLFNSLNQLLTPPLGLIERDMLILMLTMIKAHRYHSTQSPEDARLIAATKLLIHRFKRLSGMPFSSDNSLVSQLFAHLAPAIERCYFNIGIDHSLPKEVSNMYPRLLRTTQRALIKFEQEYQIRFSIEEVVLIAISFGAWLIQGNALQEKQILLLTRDNPTLEAQVEQQIRELTLLPLHIKYLSHDVYLQSGAPAGTAVVLTPYALQSTESAPPLIQISFPLTEPQSIQLCRILELP